MAIQPWGAILVGMIAGAISLMGFCWMQPFLEKKIHLHDRFRYYWRLTGVSTALVVEFTIFTRCQDCLAGWCRLLWRQRAVILELEQGNLTENIKWPTIVLHPPWGHSGSVNFTRFWWRWPLHYFLELQPASSWSFLHLHLNFTKMEHSGPLTQSPTLSPPAKTKNSQVHTVLHQYGHWRWQNFNAISSEIFRIQTMYPYNIQNFHLASCWAFIYCWYSVLSVLDSLSEYRADDHVISVQIESIWWILLLLKG